MMNKVLKKVTALTLVLATVITGVMVDNTTAKAKGVHVAELEQVAEEDWMDMSNATEYNVYRLYNYNTGEHFYTMNTIEVGSLVYKHRWNFELIGWVAPKESAEAVYRMYNPNSGEHFYTLSNLERDNLVSYGWNYEGIGWNSSTDNNAIPVYRLFNPYTDMCSHHYTLDMNEVNSLVSQGWVYEGISWYGNADSMETINKVNKAREDNYGTVYIYMWRNVDNRGDNVPRVQDRYLIIDDSVNEAHRRNEYYQLRSASGSVAYWDMEKLDPYATVMTHIMVPFSKCNTTKDNCLFGNQFMALNAPETMKLWNTSLVPVDTRDYQRN